MEPQGKKAAGPFQQFEEMLPIPVIPKNVPTLVPPGPDMIPASYSFDSQRARNAPTLKSSEFSSQMHNA